MERTFLRVVTLAQVLRATPLDADTQRTTAQQGGDDWGLWEFDSEAVGAIGDQSKLYPHETKPVVALHDERLEWIRASAAELQKHESLIDAFGKGDFFDPPVVLYYPPHWEHHVRDGAHRIHAAYAHTASAPNRWLRVYWNRLAWP